VNKFNYFIIAFVFSRLLPSVHADGLTETPRDIDIKSIEYSEYKPVPSNAWDSVNAYYKIKTKKANQLICINLHISGSNSIKKNFRLQGTEATLRPKITTTSNSILFDIDLESNGTHSDISYSSIFPSAFMYRYYQTGAPNYQETQDNSMHFLDYLAPYEKKLTPVGSRLVFGFESKNKNVPFLMINGKKYQDNDYKGVLLEVGLMQ